MNTRKSVTELRKSNLIFLHVHVGRLAFYDMTICLYPASTAGPAGYGCFLLESILEGMLTILFLLLSQKSLILNCYYAVLREQVM